MRLKRNKQYKRTLSIYQTHFGFREPYQILVDGTFLTAIASKGQPAHEILANTLQNAQIKAMVTPCILAELKQLAQDNESQNLTYAIRLARALDLRICKHHPVVSGRECLKSVVGSNDNHFMVASQDAQLRSGLRLKAIPVPIIHQNRAVTVIEPVNQKALLQVEAFELQKNQPEQFEQLQSETSDHKKKRRKKQPNPLSVKKKKSK